MDLEIISPVMFVDRNIDVYTSTLSASVRSLCFSTSNKSGYGVALCRFHRNTMFCGIVTEPLTFSPETPKSYFIHPTLVDALNLHFVLAYPLPLEYIIDIIENNSLYIFKVSFW
jgi:hypothetical protein